MTHFRTSATALEADAHQVRASQFITRLGTLPTITIPMAGGRWPDVDDVWSYLQEPAEFFGIPMPELTELTAALTDFAATVGRTDSALVAASVVVVEVDGGSRIVVSGTAVQPLRTAAVRISCDELVPHPHRAGDPWWRRMAARTTSRGELDQRARWLNGHGYVDGLSDGQPLLGALVFETSAGVVGVENPEPTSILDQLSQCGVIAPIERIGAAPTDAVPAWWVSPHYEMHPVAELGGVQFPIDEGGPVGAVPSFARWS